MYRDVPPPTSRGRRSAVVAAAVLLLLGGACSGDAEQSGPAASLESENRGETGSESDPAESDDQLAQEVALDGSGPGGTPFELLEGGDQVVGQVTLDVCGGDFASEAARSARYQQVAGDSEASYVSNETVVYRSAADAAQALEEVRQAVASCPDAFVESPVAGVPPLRYTFETIPGDRLAGVAEDHVALMATVVEPSGDTRTVAAVYQRRGRVMSALYGPDSATVETYAPQVGDALAELSAQEAGE